MPLENISEYSQAQLGVYVERTDDHNTEMIFNDATPEYPIGDYSYQIPTSFFSQWGSKPISWGVKGLASCTLLIMVNPAANGGVYMAHYWE